MKSLLEPCWFAKGREDASLGTVIRSQHWESEVRTLFPQTPSFLTALDKNWFILWCCFNAVTVDKPYCLPTMFQCLVLSLGQIVILSWYKSAKLHWFLTKLCQLLLAGGLLRYFSSCKAKNPAGKADASWISFFFFGLFFFILSQMLLSFITAWMVLSLCTRVMGPNLAPTMVQIESSSS